MLSSLTIKNVVLIDSLHLEGAGGLCALTGETGAGKSILLDALGLALGARAEASLVRHGAEQASVTACFDLPPKHPLVSFLKEKDIEAADTVILRRTLGRDGRSKAFINDAPVSVQLLKEAGARLAEIHGQFETQGLLDPATHRAVLDDYAGTGADAEAVRGAWDAWRAAKDALEHALADIAAVKLQEEYLRHAVAELEKLDPKPGEEEALAEKRRYLLNFEKIRDGFAQAEELLDSEDGILSLSGRLQGALERLAPAAGETISPVLEAVARARAELEDATFRIGRLHSGEADGESLEDVEERYFALKECAKKHRCAPDELPAKWRELSNRLRLVTHRDDALAELEKARAAAREKYISLAAKLSTKREKAAQKLSKAVQAELPALKLGSAAFQTECAKTEENSWGPHGLDRVQFLVSTNPRTPAGPIHKIASGGELARFTLALKVILAETGSVPVMIFDEVDSGIGGATADAVGERLARLAKNYQVLVVTHSPQVAARAAHHWHVSKTPQKGTTVAPLFALKDRQEEIARMLSGATVTKEARAQAARLLDGRDAA
jgi:DNA repair protein RecN (Recombination protein N)